MLIWTDNAISNITEFINNTRDNTKEYAKSYMKTLIDFLDSDKIIIAILHIRLNLEIALRILKNKDLL